VERSSEGDAADTNGELGVGTNQEAGSKAFAAFFQPARPAGMMKTFLYPSFRALPAPS